MKVYRLVPFLILATAVFVGLLLPANTEAGEDRVSAKDVETGGTVIETPDSREWETTLILPGWLSSIDGTLGVQGIETDVDAGIDDIIDNLDFIAAGALEVRRGPFGFILDGMYVKLGVGGDPSGPLLSNIDVSMEQVLAELTLTYRFYETDRCWIEFLAGARYVYLSNELTLRVDPTGVQEASEALSRNIFDRTTAAVKDEISKQLPGLTNEIQMQLNTAVQSRVDQAQQKVAAAKPIIRTRVEEKVTAEIQDRVQDRVDSIREAIRDRIEEGIGAPGPGIGIGKDIANSGRIKSAIREYVNARVASDLEASKAAISAKAASQIDDARDEVEAAVAIKVAEAKAQVSAAAAAARNRARKEAERRLAKAEAKLAKAIEKEITDRIPDSPVAASKEWVDPFVGFRCHCVISDRCYLVARGDIGGFGVGSDLTWNLYGALGIILTERATMELGYRYLSIDYDDDGFLFDVAMLGPFMGIRWEF